MVRNSKGINSISISLALSLVLIFTLLFYCNSPYAYSKEKDAITKAVSLYQHQNYEEALTILKEESDKNPQSSVVAYYLGLTYKQMQDYLNARLYLEKAATLKPPVTASIPELIDVLYQSDELQEAKKWIEIAEKDGISPPQAAFLKGLVLLKENKDPEKAIAAFEYAGQLDSSMAGPVEYHKGIAYLQMKKLAAAKNAFRTTVTGNPTGDLAIYANEYADMIAMSEKATKPFRGSITAALQYDSNVILKPDDDTLASNIDNQGDWRQVYTAEGEYNLKFNDRFGVKSAGSFYYGKQFDFGFYDLISSDVSLSPAIYLDNALISFPAHYNNVRVNDKYYLGLVGFGTFDNVMLDKNNMAQFSFMHNRKYFNWQAIMPNDDRDSQEYVCSVGLYNFFTKNHEGIVFARYTINYEQAKGNNWTYFGNRFMVGSTIPLAKQLKWNIVCDYFNQDFVKVNTTYEKARTDNIITIANLVAFEVRPDCEVQLQHTFVNDAASIGAFKYHRNIYSVGIKYKF